MQKTNIEIEPLLTKLLWQMTGEEFCVLAKYALSNDEPAPNVHTQTCIGVHALAEQLSCCDSTIYMLKREGILDEAIKSQVGKKIVFDIERARAAADKFQKARRAANK